MEPLVVWVMESTSARPEMLLADVAMVAALWICSSRACISSPFTWVLVRTVSPPASDWTYTQPSVIHSLMVMASPMASMSIT